MRIGGKGILILSWLALLASFYLPATNVLGVAGNEPGTPLTGWQAFESSILAGAFNPWVWIADLRVLWFLVFPFTNALMLAAPVFGWLREHAFVPAIILAGAAIVPWQLPHGLTGDLFVGFYVWNGSYVLAFLGGCILAASYVVDPEDDV